MNFRTVKLEARESLSPLCCVVIYFRRYSALLTLLFLAFPVVSAHRRTTLMTGTAAKGGAPANLKVVPDLEQRVAKFRRVQMPFRTEGLSARDQQLVRKLVEACG